MDLRIFLIKVFLLLNFPFSHAMAESKWTIGGGIGHLNANAYIGTNEKTIINVPFPYFKLSTKWFDANKESTQLKLFNQTPFRLGLNYDVSLPVKSEDISKREGMSDLDPLLQIGPMLSYQLNINSNFVWKWELPLLYAFSINDRTFNPNGWNVMPRISANLIITEFKSTSSLTWSFGPVYGSKQYHQYYYSINDADSTTNRSEYLATEGLAGYRINFSFRKETENYWFGFYIRHQNLTNAVFVDSPLVSDTQYWSTGIGMGWRFAGNL